MSEDKLHQHIHATYFILRSGIAYIAIALPILLLFGGWYYGIEHQESMSAYYHAAVDGKSMRDWFVGLLFAIGVFLYLYKGYSDKENYVLNISGVLAICIAIFPMEWGCGDGCNTFSIHGICAAGFFICLTYACIFCSSETLQELKDPEKVKRYRRAYMIIGLLMVASPVIAFLLTIVLQQYKSITFYIELVGIWAFASYWLLKSRELNKVELV